MISRQTADRVGIAVEDDGPGIDENCAVRIFDAFFTTKDDGLGMGLAISRSIVDRHLGHLWAESRPPCGAVFHIDLPSEPQE